MSWEGIRTCSVPAVVQVPKVEFPQTNSCVPCWVSCAMACCQGARVIVSVAEMRLVVAHVAFLIQLVDQLQQEVST